MKTELELVQFKTYTGTMESLEDLVKNLKWEFGHYYLDVCSPKKELINAKLGLKYHIGDIYTYRVPEDFEVFG